MRDAGKAPRGIEVLVKKAAVDAAFRKALVEKRAGAAGDIGLGLDPAEAAMLVAVPVSQLEAIIDGTRVSERVRPAFLGKAAAVMLAALGVSDLAGCNVFLKPKGIEPDRPPKVQPKPELHDSSTKPGPDKVTRGIRPDRAEGGSR